MPKPARPARPCVDYSYLSPSGRESGRQRRASIERTRQTLFGNGFVWPDPLPKQPTKGEYLLRMAAELRDFAQRGMKPRAYRKEAKRLEALAALPKASK